MVYLARVQALDVGGKLDFRHGVLTWELKHGFSDMRSRQGVGGEACEGLRTAQYASWVCVSHNSFPPFL